MNNDYYDKISTLLDDLITTLKDFQADLEDLNNEFEQELENL